MKKYIQIAILIFICYFHIFSQARDGYFPIHIGDTWEWKVFNSDSTYFDVITNRIEKPDGSIDVYFNQYEKPSYRVKSNGNVYKYLSDNTLEIWYDFTVAPGDTFYTTVYSADYYVVVDSLEGILFGEQTKIRIFRWYDKIYRSFFAEQRLSDKFGLYYTTSYLSQFSSSSVVGCKISGVSYGTIVSVEKNNNDLAEDYYLLQNYPNPFNPTTKISFSIPNSSHVSLKVYDILGREVAVLADKIFSEGRYEFEFNAINLPSGTYIYRLRTENKTIMKKMLLLK
jgi:hypothetical protein